MGNTREGSARLLSSVCCPLPEGKYPLGTEEGMLTDYHCIAYDVKCGDSDICWVQGAALSPSYRFIPVVGKWTTEPRANQNNHSHPARAINGDTPC